MKRICFSILFLAAAFGIKAQQDAMYSMYMFNGLFLNPAYAGSHEVISLVGIYRHQWAGFDGAPRTANISVHSPFKQDQYALGATMMYDKLGLTNNFTFTPAFSYRLKIKKSRLCFGAQASFTYYGQSLSTANLGSAGDNAFSINENLFLPNFGFGVYAYGARYWVGFSVPHLLPNSLSNQFKVVKANDQLAKQYNHFILTAGGVIGKDPSIVKFKPSIMMRYVKGQPSNIPDMDFSLSLLFIERVWVGLTYRSGGNAYTKNGKEMKFGPQAIIPMVEFMATPQLKIGYAYDYEFSRLKTVQSGTHEIMVGYDFWYNKKRFVTPRYVKYF